MNIQTITMPRKEAHEAFREYREAFRRDGQARDAALMRGYKALAKGRQVIDLGDVMKVAGVDELQRPRLAICRADATRCRLEAWQDGALRFWMDREGGGHESRRFVAVPAGTFSWPTNTDVRWALRKFFAIVPMIPPRYRPVSALSNFHVLWEATWQTEPPKDPMLLRRLDGMLFAVLAVWDLSELERAVLRR